MKKVIEDNAVCDVCGATKDLKRDDLNNILCPDCFSAVETDQFEAVCDSCGEPLENPKPDEFGNIFCNDCRTLKEKIDAAS